MSINNKDYKIEPSLLLVGILAGFLIAVITTILWGVDRTLGLGDEGIYLLAARYPEEIQQHVSSVYIYTGYIFKIVGYDPVAFRLLGVTLVCISAAILWLGYYNFICNSIATIKRFKYFAIYSLFFTLLGALLLYQWFYLTPNYNTLIAIAINISAGFVLWGFDLVSRHEGKFKSIYLIFIIAGVAVGLSLFTKFPAGFSIFTVYAFVFLIWPKLNLKERFYYFSAFLCGIFLWALFHYLFIQSPRIWWGMLNEGWSLYQAYGAYSPYSKLIAYVFEFIDYLKSSVYIYMPIYFGIFATWMIFYIYRFAGGMKNINHFLFLLIVFLAASLLSIKSGVYIDERHRPNGEIPFYLLFHLGWIILLTVLIAFSIWNKTNIKNANIIGYINNKIDLKIIITVCLLIALPIAGSTGTANPIYNLPLCHAATWFAAILILLEYLTLDDSKSVWLRIICMISVGSFTTSQIIQGYIFNPQTNGRNLHYQVNPTNIGYPSTVLKLDIGESNLIAELSLAAKSNGFKMGDDIIAFNFIPGVVYAMGVDRLDIQHL